MPGLAHAAWASSHNTASHQQFPTTKYSVNQSTSFLMGQASSSALAQRRPTVPSSGAGDGQPGQLRVNANNKDA
jgi:hypothetical protein